LSVEFSESSSSIRDQVELAFGKAAASFCPGGALAPWFHGTISRVDAERQVL
jgi:hypothetical protein